LFFRAASFFLKGFPLSRSFCHPGPKLAGQEIFNPARFREAEKVVTFASLLKVLVFFNLARAFQSIPVS
jgi:hypothetical protein